MATSYWLSHRLHDSDGWQATYADRLQGLHDEIAASSGDGANWWLSTTSFYIFNSQESLDDIAIRVKRAIAEAVDLVVVGMNEFKGGYVIGNCPDGDIFLLVPDMVQV